MANKSQRILGGLAAGLSKIGDIEQRRELEAEEQKRFEASEARKERQLAIQEQDALQRKNMNELNLQMGRATHNNKMMMQAYIAAKDDPVALAAAMSQFGNTGRKYTYNPSESAESGEIVFDVGTFTETANGGVKPGINGKPEVTPLPLSSGKARFADQDALNNHIIKSADPEFLLAMERLKGKSAIVRKEANELMIDKLKNDKKFRAEMEATPEGKRFIEKHNVGVAKTKASTELIKEQARQLKKGKPGAGLASQAPTSKVRDIRGEEQGLTDAEKQIGIANQKSYEKRGFEGISVQESIRLAELSEDPTAKQEIAQGLAMVQTGELTEAQFRQLADTYGVPVQHFDNILEQAAELEGLAEEEASESAGGGFLKGAVKLIDKLINPSRAIANVVTGGLSN